MTKAKKKIPLLLTVLGLFLVTVEPASASVSGVVFNLVTSFLGMFTGIAGLMLNYSIDEFVVGFGYNFLNTSVGVAVDLLWVKVRDIFNLTFIFGLVFIGFKMILDSSNSSTKRWLVHLIMAALLVNFSLYITKLVVDFTNLLATQIAVPAWGATGQIRISDQFMQILGISGLLGPTPQLATDSWAYVFGTAFIMIVMIFVFAAGGIMLTIRYAVLCIYMVLSPLMFLGWVFPQFQSVSNKYWRGFLGKAFFAPAYVLMLYFSYYIIDGFFANTSSGIPYSAYFSSTNGQTLVNNFGSIIPIFALSSVFLIASVVVASKLGTEGGAGAVRMMSNAQKNVQARINRGVVRTRQAAVSAATYPARSVARRSSYALGRTLDRGIKAMQAADPQKTFGKTVGRIARSAAVDRASENMSNAMTGARFGMAGSITDDQQRRDIVSERARQRREAMSASNDYRANQNSTAPGDTSNFVDQLEQQRAIGAQMNQMGAEEMSNLGFSRLSSPEFAANLTDSMITALQKTGRFKTEDIHALRNARTRAQIDPAMAVMREGAIAEIADPRASGSATQAQIDAYETNQRLIQAQQNRKNKAYAHLNQNVSGMSAEQLAKEVGIPQMNDPAFAQFVTDAQLKDMENKGLVMDPQIRNIKQARAKAITKEAEDVLDGAASSAGELEGAFAQLSRTIKSLSGDRLNSLGMNQLTSERIAMNLSDTQIDSIQQSGQYTPDQIKKIREARDAGLIARATGNFQGTLASGKSLVSSSISNLNPQNGPLTADYADFRKKQAEALFTANPTEAGKLPVELFTNPALAEYITPQIMEQRMKNGRVSGDDREKIRANIDAYLASPKPGGLAEQRRIVLMWKNAEMRSSHIALLGLQNLP